MLDYKITGGLVFDGTGGAPIRADVGLRGERIALVGDLAAAESLHTVDASDLYVCPGFIDAHSHSDAYLLVDPAALSKVYQGVTTEIVGQCGASAAPLCGAFRLPSDWADKPYPGKWSRVAEYRQLLQAARPAVNIRMLTGHRNLRCAVMGYEGRAASADEIKAMECLLEEAMEQGAAGLSVGLIYAPAMFAAADEIYALARIVARRGGLYATHMRSEGRYLLESIDESLDVARQTGVAVRISHLKTSGRDHWHKVDAALEKLRAARDEGLNIAADRYPYTASCTDLDAILPVWAAEGGRERILARLRDVALRERMRVELAESRDENGWQSVWIGSTTHPDLLPWRGRPLSDAAAAWGMTPVDAALCFLELDQLCTSGFFFGMSEENMMRILAEPYVMLGSDASIRSPAGPLSHDFPHPRAYGTFPRFLRWALDGKGPPVPEAIRKMTSLPAETLGLRDRGCLACGRAADVLVFDPKKLADRATYAQPHALATGMRWVFVNGLPVLAEGRLAGHRPGRFLD